MAPFSRAYNCDHSTYYLYSIYLNQRSSIQLLVQTHRLPPPFYSYATRVRSSGGFIHTHTTTTRSYDKMITTNNYQHTILFRATQLRTPLNALRVVVPRGLGLFLNICFGSCVVRDFITHMLRNITTHTTKNKYPPHGSATRRHHIGTHTTAGASHTLYTRKR